MVRMSSRGAKTTEWLYGFHRLLNRPFTGPEELLSRALRLIEEKIPVDRISMFTFRPRENDLALQYCQTRGLWLEMDGEIHLTEFSPLWRLLRGNKRSLSYRLPHPLLYVPLRWPPGAEGQPLGVLRFERVSSARPFGVVQREFAASLAGELSQNLQSIRVSAMRQQQLRRMETLSDLNAVFATSLRVEDGLKLILQGITQHFQLDRVRLYLTDRTRETLRGELSVDIRGRVVSLRSEEIALKSSEHRFARILRGEGLDSHMKRYEERVVYVPLTVQGQKTGLLIVDNLISQQAIPGEDVGLLKSFAGQIALAVDNSRLFEEVQALSLYDELTGLPVRRFFQQRFQEELYRVERSREPLSIAMIDIDFFKGVNDTYGHQVGDQLLREVGSRILANLRKIDFSARWGGDEIMILLPQTDAPGAEIIMKRLLQTIREVKVSVPFAKEKELSVSASIGISTYPDDGRTCEDLIGRADEALYWVKSKGRNDVATFRGVAASRSGAGVGLKPDPAA